MKKNNISIDTHADVFITAWSNSMKDHMTILRIMSGYMLSEMAKDTYGTKSKIYHSITDKLQKEYQLIKDIALRKKAYDALSGLPGINL